MVSSDNPGKNICDDGCYKQLALDLAKICDLIQFRNEINKIIDKMKKDALSESDRLKELGYDLDKLQVVNISGMPEIMLKELRLKKVE